MPIWVLPFLERKRQYQVRQSLPIASYALRIRRHRRHAHLVPLFNAALEQMKVDGRLERTLAKYR